MCNLPLNAQAARNTAPYNTTHAADKIVARNVMQQKVELSVIGKAVINPLDIKHAFIEDSKSTSLKYIRLLIKATLHVFLA